VTKTQWNKTF